MKELTEAQRRLLIHMDKFGPAWFSLVELDRIKLLEADDVVVVPSLVELGYVMGLSAIQSIALTRRGMDVAEALRDELYDKGLRE